MEYMDITGLVVSLHFSIFTAGFKRVPVTMQYNVSYERYGPMMSLAVHSSEYKYVYVFVDSVEIENYNIQLMAAVDG